MGDAADDVYDAMDRQEEARWHLSQWRCSCPSGTPEIFQEGEFGFFECRHCGDSIDL